MSTTAMTASLNTSLQMVTISQATSMVAAALDSPGSNIYFVLPGQIVDGGIVTFVNGDTQQVVAHCRLRFSNELTYNADSTHLQLGVYLSNIVLNRKSPSSEQAANLIM